MTTWKETFNENKTALGIAVFLVTLIVVVSWLVNRITKFTNPFLRSPHLLHRGGRALHSRRRGCAAPDDPMVKYLNSDVNSVEYTQYVASDETPPRNTVVNSAPENTIMEQHASGDEDIQIVDTDAEAASDEVIVDTSGTTDSDKLVDSLVEKEGGQPEGMVPPVDEFESGYFAYQVGK